MATNNSDDSTPSIPTPATPTASSAPKAKATPSAKKPTAAQSAAKSTPAAKATAAKTTASTPAAAKSAVPKAAPKSATVNTTTAKIAAAPPVPPVAPKATPAAASAAADKPTASNDPYSAPSGTPIPGYEGASTPGQAPFAPVPAGPSQGLSIASMATGISGILLSFLFFGFLPGVAAVVMGHMAQKKQPHARPFWFTGLITGYISVAIGLITGIIFILFLSLFFAGLSGFSGFGPNFRGEF